MSSSPQASLASPFVSFPVGTALSATSEVGSGPNLDFLGQSSAGDLYLNRDFASVGLVCGSSMEDLETVVRRLVAAHAGDLDARILILYSQKFVGKRKPCTLLNSAVRKPKIFISPRNLESSTKLYASASIKTSPLNFQESALTTQHLLEFFTPPADMQGRSMVLNTIQLIISQLREPFDLQYFIEMTEKENWTEDAANFMALRQTILTSLLSSPQSKQPNASPSFGGGTILDLGDPLLRHTGLESIMMDMLLHQFLLDSSGGRRLLVLYNSHEYLSMGSPLSSSLESLATSGSNRATSIILATTSPSSVPLEYYNSVDYLVYSNGRSSVWNSTLREHFCLEPPTTRRMPGEIMIWSPDSLHIETDHTEDPVRVDGQILMALSELSRTMPQSHEHPGIIWADGSAVEKFDADVYSLASNTPPVSDVPSASSPLNDEEEGMIPLNSIYMDNPAREESPMPGLHYEAEVAKSPSLQYTVEVLKTPVSTADSLPSAASSRRAALPSRPPSAFLPLISAILRVSDGRNDALVSFEVVRSILGDQAAIKKLGWGTYTSYVDDARLIELLDVVETPGGFKFIRLLPSSLLLNVSSATTPPVIKAKPVIASPQVHPPPSKQAPSTSKLKPKSVLAVPAKVQAPTTTKAALPPITQICPAKYLPLVKAILKLSKNNLQAKVSFNAVGGIVGNTKEELQARGYQWVSYGHWAQKAQEEGWIVQGGFEGWRWMMLGSKLTERS